MRLNEVVPLPSDVTATTSATATTQFGPADLNRWVPHDEHWTLQSVAFALQFTGGNVVANVSILANLFSQNLNLAQLQMPTGDQAPLIVRGVAQLPTPIDLLPGDGFALQVIMGAAAAATSETLQAVGTSVTLFGVKHKP